MTDLHDKHNLGMDDYHVWLEEDVVCIEGCGSNTVDMEDSVRLYPTEAENLLLWLESHIKHPVRQK